MILFANSAKGSDEPLLTDAATRTNVRNRAAPASLHDLAGANNQRRLKFETIGQTF
jgi:hypothetical protein